MQKANWSGHFRLALLSMCAVGAIAAPSGAYAQDAAPTAQSSFDFNIPSQSLARSLNQIAERSNIQIVYPDKEPSEITAPAVNGTMTVAQALATALAGSPYTFSFVRPGVVTLVRADGEGVSGERVLGAVRVQGAQGGGSLLAGATPVNGVNGSRDVTATEGTGSYTSNALTVGSKTAASIKDTPMSVSVITDQQLKDQNITDLNGAMRNAPGITVINTGADAERFVSRGYAITQLQIDGGAAQLISAPSNVGNYRPLIDLSLYDHVELVRGATGTFNAYGSPGGVINLVRKRPLDHAQMTIDMQLGSWDWHRFSADVTGPLAFDGKLRARFIATHQDNNYFYDIAKANRNVLSGTLEFDVTPTTLFTAGMTYQDENNVPRGLGLPRYQTGKVIDFPLGRATCLCLPWAKNNAQNLELFGQVEQRIGDSWALKFKINRVRQESLGSGASVAGAVDPILGTGPIITLGPVSSGRVKQTQFEMTIDGSFRLFGQVQKVLFGANYSMIDPAGSFDAAEDYTSSNIYFMNGMDNRSKVGDVRKFDPYAWQPAESFGKNPFRGYKYADTRILNAYVSLDLVPLAGFHINTAIRYSQTRNRYLLYDICTPDLLPYFPECKNTLGTILYDAGGSQGHGSSFSWPPSLQLRYDVTKTLSAYAAYTDIYIDQSQLVTAKGESLPPATGANYEGGIKWLSPGKKTNITLDVFYTKQIGTNTKVGSKGSSPTVPGQLNSVVQCCYAVLPGSYTLSYGADFEISGEIARGVQLSASYTYNFNKDKRPTSQLYDGTQSPLESRAPRHLAKLWATYTFDDRSKLNGLRLGLGAQARSSTFAQDSYCPVDPISTPDGPQCPSSPGLKYVFFTDPGYVVLSGSIGYRFSGKLSIDAQFENLLDKTYFEQVGGINGGNWYGSPRSVKVSLRSKF